MAGDARGQPNALARDPNPLFEHDLDRNGCRREGCGCDLSSCLAMSRLRGRLQRLRFGLLVLELLLACAGIAVHLQTDQKFDVARGSALPRSLSATDFLLVRKLRPDLDDFLARRCFTCQHRIHEIIACAATVLLALRISEDVCEVIYRTGEAPEFRASLSSVCDALSLR